jgi:guanylate kinase
VGKSTIVARLVDQTPVAFSVSATTRAPRPGEVSGDNYHFVSRDVFEVMIDAGEFLEWAEYNDNLYGTPRRPVLEQLRRGEDVLLEIEVQGARQVKASHPEAFAVFIAPPSIDALESRLAARGDTDVHAMNGRLDIARGELAAADEFDHIVINDDLDTAVVEILHILGLDSQSSTGHGVDRRGPSTGDPDTDDLKPEVNT